MAVNLSPHQLLTGAALVEQVRGCLEEYGLPASALCLEITESSVIAETTAAVTVSTVCSIATPCASKENDAQASRAVEAASVRARAWAGSAEDDAETMVWTASPLTLEIAVE